VILIDELAALAYVNDRDIRRRIENALGLLLSQGRAVGVSVVGAVQDTRKEVLPACDPFPVRVMSAGGRGRPGASSAWSWCSGSGCSC